MRFGIVSFGMGANLARQARSHGQEVVGFDPGPRRHRRPARRVTDAGGLAGTETG
jgi:6-phosphogluconate dehydrogenase (decarboxylating)